MNRILITGGARRLGRVLAEGIAAADRHVVVHYNQSAGEALELVSLLQSRGCPASSVGANLSRIDELEDLIARAAEVAGGALTALVNNAAVFNYDTPRDVGHAAFDGSIAANLRAPIVLSQKFHEQADSASDNCIVNMLDQKLWNLNPDFFSYTVSKYALRGVIEMTAMAFAPKVRVCGIAPGLLFPSYDQTPEEFHKVASVNLLQRPIDPAEVARALGFILATPGYNGQILHVDNGQRFVPLARDVMFSTRG